MQGPSNIHVDLIGRSTAKQKYSVTLVDIFSYKTPANFILSSPYNMNSYHLKVLKRKIIIFLLDPDRRIRLSQERGMKRKMAEKLQMFWFLNLGFVYLHFLHLDYVNMVDRTCLRPNNKRD